MNPTLAGLRRFALAVLIFSLVDIGAPARACPPDHDDAVPCTDTLSFLRKPPPLIGEVWHIGRAEVEVGQGMIGQVSPEAIDWLSERGVQFFAWYMIALQGNPVGGQDKAFRYTGLLDFGIDLDMETMAQVKGFWIHVSGSWASGRDLTADVGAFAPVNAVYSGDSVRLFEMYLEERMLGDRLSVRVGRISVGWEYGLEYDYFTQYTASYKT